MAKKVMVVDDEEETLAYIKLGLEMCGYDVIAISNSMHAVDLAKSMKPDILILDFLMPGMDGFDIFNGLNASNETKDIPIIFITGHMIPEVTERMLKTKAFCYMTKPFDISDLTDRISDALSLKTSDSNKTS
jgi:DNA-binding response OmpR family regulator